MVAHPLRIMFSFGMWTSRDLSLLSILDFDYRFFCDLILLLLVGASPSLCLHDLVEVFVF